MSLPSSTIIIVLVIGFVIYLIYTQNNQQQSIGSNNNSNNQGNTNQCPPCNMNMNNMAAMQKMMQPPAPINVNVTGEDSDPYSDAIKKQDLYTMYDPLTYPQLRLPREVLEKYNDYFNKTGVYPPFGESTQPYLFDNPQMVGVLIKKIEDEAFAENSPSSVPLFRVKSSKNANRYFYYILDQRYLSKVEQKIPLDKVKVNGIRYQNADYYGIPELFDDDVIEDIPIFPFTKFKVTLYKTYHFP
jgi:hypothetical protein